MCLIKDHTLDTESDQNDVTLQCILNALAIQQDKKIGQAKRNNGSPRGEVNMDPQQAGAETEDRYIIQQMQSNQIIS